ncbi:MAG: type IV pilus assembly protein PilM [Planctomycetota bacterium]|jgi:type IV pilus assembly protein PilM
MAAETGAVWAIDIGSNSLKALYLSTERGVVEVMGFDNIRHGKVLSGGDVTEAEREELVALSLRKFVNKYDLSADEIAVSVPSQNSFARFVTLPPVEQKRIPEMVKFEAVQQIPFGINDVQWDWQMMSEPDSSEIKVGIFAIKNEVVNSVLEHFNREDLQVSYVQMAPMSLYNYLLNDRPKLVTSDSQATVVLNIGAENTDLVVCTKSGVWQRCILIGGNAFTKAIADTFRLSFEKAEKLKRTAPVSKYARQIFQAMRPVFTDLASEVQRSLGFYNSSNPNTKIVRIVALGGGTKLRGLLKYLQQTLQIPVEKPDAFKRLGIGPGVSPAKFHENVGDFGIVYGLALQGLGLARIESNLLPRTVARSMAWAGKSTYFIVAACLLLAVSMFAFGRTNWDRMNYTKNNQVRLRTASIVNDVQNSIEQFDEVKRNETDLEAKIEAQFDPFKHREIIPLLHETIISALPNEKNNPGQAGLYRAFAEGDVAELKKIPRNQRKQVFLTLISAYYTNDLAKGQFGGADLWRKSRATPGLEGGEFEGEYSEYEYEMMMAEEMGYDMGMFAPGFMGGATAQDERKQGFVVTIAGYSPYGNSITELGTLLDPHGVENQPEKWGFVSRLANLDAMVEDGNSPFVLYERADPEQFKLEMKEVTLDVEMPEGIGTWQERPAKIAVTGPRAPANVEWDLVDPMTHEVINKIAEVDETGKQRLYRGKPVFKVNDHWFVLNVKFVWKDAPEPPPQPAGMYPFGMPSAMPPSPPSSGGQSTMPGMDM